MSIPVLLLLFNRPDLTSGLIRMLRGYAPDKVYIAIDGPRADREGEVERCAEVRRITEDGIDWLSEIHWLERERNLGCGPAVKGALDWFFEHEECGIILEDDCHPSADFFRFQEAMLQTHAHNEAIFMVSGNSFLPESLRPKRGCYLSKYTSIWGWGTWRSRWHDYQFEYPENEWASWEEVIRSASCSSSEATYWIKEFEKLRQEKVPHTWDIQLQFSAWKTGRKNIFPPGNLVTNYGFGPNATHTKVFNERLVRQSVSWLNEETSLPEYASDLDALLFWMHVLEGNPERFKQLLLENSPEFRLLESQARESSRLIRDPSMADLIHIAGLWLRRKLSHR